MISCQSVYEVAAIEPLNSSLKPMRTSSLSASTTKEVMLRLTVFIRIYSLLTLYLFYCHRISTGVKTNRGVTNPKNQHRPDPASRKRAGISAERECLQCTSTPWDCLYGTCTFRMDWINTSTSSRWCVRSLSADHRRCEWGS